MTTTPTEAVPAVQALALLALPGIGELTERQVRGATCVWDATEEPLTDEAAVDLGPRRAKRLDGHYDWHPRGCPRHVGQAALLALANHCMSGCPTCSRRDENRVAIPGVCDTGLALLLAHMRKGRS